MKKVVLTLAALSVLAGTAAAQNADDAFEKFKRQQELDKQAFADQRAEEYARFKAAYYGAFEQFVRLYQQYLKDDEAVMDLMASDDGIEVRPEMLAVQPKVVTTVADQKQILAESMRNIRHLKPEDLIPVLSDKQDTVERMQEAAGILEEIVKDMATVAVEENDGPVNVTTEVVLEPYDPEYFSKLPSLEEISGNEASGSSETEASAAGTSVGTSSATASESSAGLSSSVPSGKPTEYVRISSPFGTRVHPITRKKHTHKGIDLAAPKMTPIYATADGEVTFSGRNGGYGNFVKINHRNGYKTAYAHMHRIAVKKGADVHKGDLVGYVGTTGSSTGDHLHYEVYYQDKLVDPATTL